ncbi:MAG: UDP-glucose 4-epimerase GalE [bacterium]|nr:UDP-glucose 4-epimerase GalE [bacterium]
MINLLITGSSGYIASTFIYKLLSQYTNYQIIAIDKVLSINKEKLLSKFKNKIKFYQLDLLNYQKLEEVFKTNEIDIVIHFAALTLVNESENEPFTYLNNNLNSTINLLDLMIKYNVFNIVFSSSASVYGNAIYTPIDENHPPNPLSFYGLTKKISEEIIINYNRKGLNYIILRYFNPAGVIDDLGEEHNPETHLIPLLIKSIINKTTFKVYGNNYNTPDGTCIRDFIHISDLVDAHILSLESIINEDNLNEIFNVGINKGYSILQVIETAQKVLNQKVNYIIDNPRKGDVPILVAKSDKIISKLRFSPKYDLSDIIIDVFNYEKSKQIPKY